MEFIEYECAGLRLRSEIPIAAPTATGGVFDNKQALSIALGATRPMPLARPSSDVLAEVVREGVPWWTASRVAGGTVLRVFGVCDFVIDEELRDVTCFPVLEGRPEVIPVIITGLLVALILELRGQCVLHASAVEIDGLAVAFVGLSGQGKTTVATMLCVEGAPLVTDDVLPVEFVASGEAGDVEQVRVHRSGHELRLRLKAESLAARFGSTMRARRTSDDRYAIEPGRTGIEELRLALIVVPMPERKLIDVRSRPLSQAEAALMLGRCDRVEGWNLPSMLAKHFVDVTRIVRSVPVIEIAVPWGPPFRQEVAKQMLEVIRGNAK
jgi:hypothetical protein